MTEKRLSRRRRPGNLERAASLIRINRIGTGRVSSSNMMVRTLTFAALSLALLGAAAHCAPDAEDRPRLESGDCSPGPGVRCGFVRGPGAIGGSGGGSTGAPIAAGGNVADGALPGDTTGGGQTSFGDGGLFGDAGNGGSSDPLDPFNPFGTGASDLFPPGLGFDGG